MVESKKLVLGTVRCFFILTLIEIKHNNSCTGKKQDSLQWWYLLYAHLNLNIIVLQKVIVFWIKFDPGMFPWDSPKINFLKFWITGQIVHTLHRDENTIFFVAKKY